MTPRGRSRQQRCGPAEARTRLSDARAQLEHAELADGSSSTEEMKAATSSAVLAGIAAADAACCKAIGRRNRSQNHEDAAELLKEVSPGGRDAARRLTRLLALKDHAQYGFSGIGGGELKQAQRNARALMEFAESVLLR
jgi:hypothetical protein